MKVNDRDRDSDGVKDQENKVGRKSEERRKEGISYSRIIKGIKQDNRKEVDWGE